MARDPQIDKLIQDAKTRQFRDGEAKGLVSTIGDEIKSQLAPLFTALSKEITTTVKDSLSNVKINVPKSDAPNVQIPEFPQIPPFPEMKAPIVNVPAPIVNIPAPQVTVNPSEVNFPSEMSLKAGNKPFPVIMHDAAGKPINFNGMGGGATGGRGDFFAIRDIQTSSGASVIDQVEGAVKVVGSFSVSASNSSTQSIDSSGTPYSQANPFPVVFSSSATTASNIVDSSGIAYSGTNPLPVTFTGVSSTSVSLVNADGAYYNSDNPLFVTTTTIGKNETGVGVLRAVLMSDTASSMNMVAFNGNTPSVGLNETNAGVLRMVQMSDTASSVVVNSGTITTVTTLTGVTNSVAVVALDRDGNPLTTGPIAQGDSATALRIIQAGDSVSSVVVNSGTITTVTTVTGVTNTVTVRLDTPDGIVTTANPFPIAIVSGGLDSTTVTVAHTVLPVAKSDGADVRPMADKYGRNVSRTLQVRDLVATAYVSLSTGTEATLLAASAGKLYDLVWVLLSNQSTAAVQVDVRPVLAGNILMTFQVPANGTVGIAPPIPLPGGADTGNAWTVDMPDITGTTVNITGLFSQEI